MIEHQRFFFKHLVQILITTTAIILFSTLNHAQDQRQYSTYDYNMQTLLEDSVQRAELKATERALHKSQAFIKPDETNYVMQLAFHNMTDLSIDEFEGQVLWQLDALNRDFSAVDESNDGTLAAGISFVYRIADEAVSPIPEWRDWHNFKNAESQFDINVWVIDLPDTIGSYASWPEGSLDRDGIVIDPAYFSQGLYADYSEGKTLSTLLAMYFGLKPLLGSHPCADDGVRDTPRYASVMSCDVSGTSGCDGRPFMPSNLMTPTDDSCRSYFTIGQVHRMKYFIEHSSSLFNKVKRKS